MRAIAIAVVALSLLVALPAPPASACSCAQRPVQAALREADGVVVATRVLRPGEDPAAFASRDLRLRVDARLKGDVPAFVTIEGDDGGSCQPYAQPAHVIALALTRGPDGAWTARACSSLALPDVLAAMGRPPADGTGPPTLLLAGGFGGDTYAATVDDRGQVLAWGRGTAPAARLVVCPGARASVEVSSGPHPEVAVTVRRLPGLEVVDTDVVPFPSAYPVALRCDAADAGAGTLVLSERDDIGRAHLVVLTRDGGDWRTVARREAQSVAALHGDRVVAVAEERPGREMATWRSTLVTIDVTSGQVTEVARLGSLAVEQVDVDPDGTVTLTGYADEHGYQRRGVDLASGRELSVTPLPGEGRPPALAHTSVEVGDRLAWAGGRRLTVTDRDHRVLSEGGVLALAATTAMASLAEAPVELVAAPPSGETTPPDPTAPNDSAHDAVTIDPPRRSTPPPLALLAALTATTLLPAARRLSRTRRQHRP